MHILRKNWIEKIEVVKSYCILYYYLILYYEFLFTIFLYTSPIINLYFLEPLKISMKLLSYAFNEVINLVHWPELDLKDFII